MNSDDLMSTQFSLFLGEERIPVVNWINRHGPPEGRRLRFTVPVEAKAKLEANREATFTLVRDDEKWEFELLSVGLATTGTNGLTATGQVRRKKLAAHLKNKLKSLVEKSQANLAEGSSASSGLSERPSTGTGVPRLDGAASEASTSETATRATGRSRSTTLQGGPASEVEEEVEQAQPVEEPRRADEHRPPSQPETTPDEAEAILEESSGGEETS